MKNRYFIFSVLFWLVASCAWAITLPTSSYMGSTADVDFDNSFSTFSIGTSSTVTGSYLGASQSYDGACNENPPVSQERTICCMGQIPEIFGQTLTECAQKYDQDCLNYYQDCLNSTSLPLGTPLLLLPFALVYAFVRRKRMAME
jgi:hypothetical protein